MTDFHAEIRHLLSEINSFFNDTLRVEKVSKRALLHKEKILDIIFKIRKDFPDLQPDPSDFTRIDEEFISDVAARELREVTKAGFLEKRRKKETLFQRGSYQRRYCVIQNGVFYYYIHPTDKKQAGAFSLKGYKFRKAPYLPEDGTKKDLSFELVCPGKRSYQFLAEITQDFKEWREAVDGDGISSKTNNKVAPPTYVRDDDDDDEYYIAVNSDDDIPKRPGSYTDDAENYEIVTTHLLQESNGNSKNEKPDKRPPILPKKTTQSQRKSHQSSRAPLKPPIPPKHKPKDDRGNDDDDEYDDDDYTDPNDLEFDEDYDDVVTRRPEYSYRKSPDRVESELYYDDATSAQPRAEVTSEIYQDAFSAH